MPSTTNVPATTANAVSAQGLPASLRQALAEAEAADHPDLLALPLPKVEPSGADIRLGILVLERQLEGVERKHAAYCLAKLASGFNERLTSNEAQLRLEVWLEACGDIPKDLWAAGTIDLLRSWQRDKHYGRVPEASDLRAAVSDRLSRRSQDLARCRAMLRGKTAEQSPQPAAAAVVETRLDRLRSTRMLYEKHNRPADVARLDREIAAEQGQCEVNQIPDARDPGQLASRNEPFKPADTPTSRRLAELAEQHRTGKPASEWRDIPEL